MIIRVAVPGKGRFILDINYAEKRMRSTAHCISYLLTSEMEVVDDYYPEFTGYPVVNSTAAAKSAFVLRDWNGGEDEFKCRTLNRIHMNINVASDKKLNHYITKQKYSENGNRLLLH